MGVPPPLPSPHHGKRPAKKLTEKKSRQKNTVFGPIFNRFFNHGKGGYPPPPHHGKRPAKKLTGKKSRQRGVPPPPSRQKAVIGVFEHFPNDTHPPSLSQMLSLVAVTLQQKLGMAFLLQPGCCLSHACTFRISLREGNLPSGRLGWGKPI